MVTIGVDAHKRVHAAVAVDATGVILGEWRGGIVNLRDEFDDGSWFDCKRGDDGLLYAYLRRQLEASCLLPDLESCRSFRAVFPRRQPMPPWTKMLTDGPKGRQEALGMPG